MSILNKIKKFSALFFAAVLAAACSFLGAAPAIAADLNPPQAPFLVFARNAAVGGKVIINWRIPADKELLGFNIYRSSDAGFTGEKLVTLNSSTSSFQDSGLANSRTYYYTVASFDAANNEAFAKQISATPTENNAALYPDGVLLKFRSRSTIYKVGTDGRTLHPISKKVFEINGYKFGQVVEIPIEWINSFYYGSVDTYRDGTLIRANGQPTVYAIENGFKRPFVSKGIFTDLGYSLKNVVVVPLASNGGLADGAESYPTGAEINSVASHSDGALIQSCGDPTVYLVKNGQRRPIPSLAVFYSHNFNLKKIISVNAAEINRYPVGENLKFMDSALIRGNSNTVYAVNNGGMEIIPFRSAVEFAGLGYKFENVISASDYDISQYRAVFSLAM